MTDKQKTELLEAVKSMNAAFEVFDRAAKELARLFELHLPNFAPESPEPVRPPYRVGDIVILTEPVRVDTLHVAAKGDNLEIIAVLLQEGLFAVRRTGSAPQPIFHARSDQFKTSADE